MEEHASVLITTNATNKLRNGFLRKTLETKTIEHEPVAVIVSCPKLTAIGWGKKHPTWTRPFKELETLVGVDLSGCPKLREIPDSSFDKCWALTDLKLHNNITKIGVSAFNRCNSLISVTTPSSLKHLSLSSFSNCISLESLTLNDTLTSIGQSCFFNCRSLKKVVFPRKCKVVEEKVFAETVVFNRGVKTMGRAVFQRCARLEVRSEYTQGQTTHGIFELMCQRYRDGAVRRVA